MCLGGVLLTCVDGPYASGLVRRCPWACHAARHSPLTVTYFLRRLLTLFFSSAWPRFVQSPWCR